MRMRWAPRVLAALLLAGGTAAESSVAGGRAIPGRPQRDAGRPMRWNVSSAASEGAQLPSAGRVVARVAVPNSPLGLLALSGAVWVTAHRGTVVYRIDAASNKVVAHVGVAQGGGQPGRMTVGDGTIFAENYSGDAVSLIDPSRSARKSTIHAPLEDCCWPAYGAGSLWLLEYSSASTANPDRLVRLDRSGHVLTKMRLSNAIGLTFGAGSLWGASGGRVFRLDPATNRVVAHISADAEPISFGAGSVWGLSSDGARLIRIGPAQNKVTATIRLPAPGSVVSASDNAVWVAEGPLDSPGSHLWKIDPATNRVVGQVRLRGVASSLDDVAIDANGDVWVSAFDANDVLRIHPTG